MSTRCLTDAGGPQGGLFTRLRQRARSLLDRHLWRLIMDIRRRVGWLTEHLTPRLGANVFQMAASVALKRPKVYNWPLVLKIDISPLCNLRCTTCIHARPDGNPLLASQEFRPEHKMTLQHYRGIIDECRGKVSAVSLYYLGDPLVHPDLAQMCRLASDAGMTVHISSNFSLRLSDERIRELVSSGLTHLTVCVDGLSQEKYQMTRVGGRIELVLDNLRRVCEYRRRIGWRYPRVEVQYLKFTHNLDEVDQALRVCHEMGVDQFSHFWGDLRNYVEWEPDAYKTLGPKKPTLRPYCLSPYLYMLIKYNGDVLPCCTHRVATQYVPGEDSKALGNVFQTSVRAVWNSPQYQQIRRLIANPEQLRSDPSLKKRFCYGCPRIFETDVAQRFGPPSKMRMNDLYTFDDHGRPVRRPETWSTPWR